MAESTFQNEVYIDVYGKVCSPKDKNLLRKISRQEAVRMGLIPASEAPAPITDPALVIHADGSTQRVVMGAETAASLANPEEVRVTDAKEESARVQGKTTRRNSSEDDEEEIADEKAVKSSEVEDKAVHKTETK